MLAYEGDPEYAEHSATSLRAGRRAARGGARAGSITMDTLHGFLADHEQAPDSLCRHEAEGRTTVTAFWCVADVTDGVVRYGRGQPLRLRRAGVPVRVGRLTGLSRAPRAASPRSPDRPPAPRARAAVTPSSLTIAEVGAGVEQRLDASEVRVLRRRVQRREPLRLAARSDRRRPRAAAARSPCGQPAAAALQRRAGHPTAARAIVRLGAARQQEPHRVGLPEERGQVQRREPVAARGVRPASGSVAKQLAQPIEVAEGRGLEHVELGRRGHARPRRARGPSGSARAAGRRHRRRRDRSRATAGPPAAPRTRATSVAAIRAKRSSSVLAIEPDPPTTVCICLG